jgi:DNA-binding transcriptional LysR family regulator
MSLLNPNLHAFLAIVKHHTVHAAAKEIGLTQTGVTQRLRSLEQSLSTTLFLRSRRGMQLTPEGQALLRYCQAAKDLEGETLAQLQDGSEQQEHRVQITGPTSFMSSRVIPQCLPLLRANKNLLLNFHINDLEARVEDLRAGTAQLAVLPPELVAREMDSKLLKPEKYVLVGSPRWKGRRLSEIIRLERIIDFDPTDKTSQIYLQQYHLVSALPNERLFVNNNDSLIEMFHQGIGYGVLTMEMARTHLESGHLILLNSGSVLENRLALAWYPRPQMPSYFKNIVDHIK